jgi:hypothetical protein
MKLLPEAQARPSSRLAALTEAADRHDSPLSARAGMLVLLVLLSRSTRLTRRFALSGAPGIGRFRENSAMGSPIGVG